MLVVITKIIGGAATDTYVEQNKPPVLEEFINEFVVNNVNFKYPIKLNDSMTLTNRELTKLQDKIFVVENLKVMVAKKDFVKDYIFPAIKSLMKMLVLTFVLKKVSMKRNIYSLVSQM